MAECAVSAIGPGRTLENGKPVEMEVKAGDIVIYSKYAGTEVGVQDDEDVLLSGANDILAIVT